MDTFHKYEGLGNDFVVVSVPSECEWPQQRAIRLCDRHYGVGADGVLLVLPSDCADARMRVINADGSIPEMCGNGIRCVALHLARERGIDQGELTIETDAGLRTCGTDRVSGLVDVDMGVVRVLGEKEIVLDGVVYRPVLADAGNPHAIFFETTYEPSQVGPAVATHSAFLRGTNVEFATIRDASIRLVVWERGAGLTLACGTGACATAAAAVATGHLALPADGNAIAVHLPGGILSIGLVAVPEGSGNDAMSFRVRMRGPARWVFRGEV
ncbi:MAG: diaminopimelate epimerase [Myxococcales bacterium]